MRQFWDNAARLLDAALSAAHAGRATESMTVVIGVDGGIHLLPNNDWPLDRLAEERAARMVYRVDRSHGRVQVEGQSGADSCRLESEIGETPATRLLRDEPRYFL